MRIGIDMLAVQSPGSRLRGIGRFGYNLASAMLNRPGGHEFVLYVHDGFPIDHLPEGPSARVEALTLDEAGGEHFLRDAMDRLARTNPDRLDALVMLSPFELCIGYDPPNRPLEGPALAMVMHDLIPFLDQEHYLNDPLNAEWFYRRLRALRKYDTLLCNSDATRADCLTMLALPEHRVVTIGGAGNGAYFRPDRAFPMPQETRATLNRLGLRRPFILCVAGADERKNLSGLIDAYRLLPTNLRTSHDLAITCFLKPEDERAVRWLAAERGIEANLVLTGEVDDEELRILYQRCAAFAFPSHYEGLGLPLLEAMHCGAAVLAGNNSSQIEVVGNAGLLANSHDAADIAEKLARLLNDRAFAKALGDRAIEHAKTFTWERSADRALEALEQVAPRRSRLRADRGHTAKPRLAVVSPWAPKPSGVSTYAARLVRELGKTHSIDLYHDEGYVPELGLGSPEFACFDYRSLERNLRLRGYRGVLYQMGNSWYHGFIYDLLRRVPGVVTLHDYYLAGFQFWHAHLGGDAMGNFRRELSHAHPAEAAGLLPRLDELKGEPGGMQAALTRRQLAMNRRVFEAARAVIVHSPWCRERAGELNSAFASKTVVIPHGATVAPVDPAQRAATRARFGLPSDALILGSFGILASGKMNVEALDAFARVAGELPDALLVFVGQDWENGEAHARAEALNLGGRIRFLGLQPDEEFSALIAATDLGISLRRPPTYGETSGALLDLLRHGVPAIVTDVATFADYPDDAVRKVRCDSEFLPGLIAAIRELAGDPARRAAMGEAARRLVAERHAWPTVAAQYAEALERSALRIPDSRFPIPALARSLP